MNREYTKPDTQKHSMNNSGWLTCTPKNNMLPRPTQVVCKSDSTATTQ